MLCRNVSRAIAGLAVSLLLFGAAPVSAAQPELGVAEIHRVGYPTEAAVEEFARLVQLYSNGSLNVRVYPDGQITGNERTAVEMVQKGTIAFARVSVGVLGAFNSRLNLFGLPYLFDSKQHMWAFLNGPYGRSLLDDLAASGLIGLCWYDAGARSFYARKPLRGIDDLKGLRIRTHSNPIIMRTVQAMGGEAVPLGTSQILPALEKGTVDAAENNAPTLLALEHYRIARHFMLNEHLRLPEVLFMSKVAWERLDSEQQRAVRRAAEESVVFQRAKWDAFEREAMGKLASEGVEIVRVNDVTPFKNAVKKLVEEEAPRYRDALRAVEEARAKK